MRTAGVDVLLLSLGADLPWLSGYEAMPLERPTVLVFPADDRATLVVPELEAPRVAVDERLFALRPYRESGDAVAITAELVGRRRRVAVSDRAWAGLLLALQASLPRATWSCAVGRHRPRARRERRTGDRRPPRGRRGRGPGRVGTSRRRDRPHRQDRGRGRGGDLGAAPGARSREGELRDRGGRAELGEPAPRGG